ncbi:Transcriptional regulator, MerR family [Sulfitobacter noctilucicola]|uniref:DNA-binding transcriptional MerR regulator n=1 Tax=Sulfitobacter noctilucicola TaxID=1342301 RepID=A0A7W6M8G9_9RHOB|nr:MerR family transcriptional regulator [Sulfitobacter noctilucicola]KIN64838.1 Transcriptional regulator, MerR family [Sulfitobacter noctilucicola]MBB4174018.1 DNA-binding transcriptional MerR regulator [Sulfitobacter noctilucicola]
MSKSPDAFRTISEVADWLGIQAHVLRFWESKFTQVRPIKRAGGRRYYRPSDMQLLGGIKQLLHEDGLTIKGVQKILREEGMSHVAALSPQLDELTQSEIDDTPEAPMLEEAVPEPEEKGVVLNFDAPKAAEPDVSVTKAAEPEAVSEPGPTPEPLTEAAPDAPAEKEEPEPEPQSATEAKTDDLFSQPAEEVSQDDASTEVEAVAETPEPPVKPETGEAAEEDALDGSEDVMAQNAEEVSEPIAHSEEAIQNEDDTVSARKADDDETDDNDTTATLPAFLRRPMNDQAEPTDNAPAESAEPTAESEPEPAEPEHAAAEPATDTPVPEPQEATADEPVEAEPAALKPRIIDLPPFTPENEFDAKPALLSQAIRTRHLSKDQARQIAPLLSKLTILRDSMAARRRNPAPQDTAD